MATIRTSSPQRILIVTLADLGDALLTTPALRALRKAHPNAHITIVATPISAAVLRDIPVHDELIIFEKGRFDRFSGLFKPANLSYAFRLWRTLRRTSYDTCVILRHLTTWFGTFKYVALALASGARRRYGLDNGRGWFLTDRIRDEGFGAQHEAEYWLAVVGLLGAQTSDHVPRFPVADAAAATIRTQIESYGDTDQPLIALHPGSGGYSTARRWPPQRFAALADALIEDGNRIVLVGGSEEADLRRTMLSGMRHAAAIIDLGGRTTLQELAAALQQCALFVGNDSGLAHLASSVGTPVVALFGPTAPEAWGPYGGEAWHTTVSFENGVELLGSGTHRVLRASIACSPCIYRGHQLGTPQGCPDRTCLRRIDVAQPLSVIRQRLQEL